MLEQQADRVMELSEWNQRWQENKIGFHQPGVHSMLQTNYEAVVNGRSGVRWFFPLCGKSVDMKWLADLGHSVVGVEISETAIRQFFQENNMTFSEEDVPAVPGAKVFQNSDRSVSLYQCDLFIFSSAVAGRFGAIWDRGSLVAINAQDRDRYAALIVSLMAPDCRYLLDTLLYNPELYKGPPFYVPEEQVQSLFGSRCDVKLLQSVDALTDRQRAWGLEALTENVHLLTLRAAN
ncbi:probable thiopurine S-methyltransferase [Xiphophorus hellerii]|uniref:probable thiopurine S-methyltransferase n=1 Tax=Xiphophorus hellerii TaxID=8084 RepID=UPI0013B3FE98|nr:thiopurine S-methyltransferase [Xiphophorus hellerii]XP_032435869.1 thiopurine S-methyltransferase [Xiphophorus hellerii]